MDEPELPIVQGGISGIGLPYDLNDVEIEEVAIELAKALAKKRPLGFAPWPNDNQQEGNE